MSAIHHVTALAEAVCEHHFHLNGFLIRHGIEVRVQPRNKAFAESTDHAGGLGPPLVILEALLWREAGHADVVGGLAVAARVAEINDVDVMVIAGRRLMG